MGASDAVGRAPLVHVHQDARAVIGAAVSFPRAPILRAPIVAFLVRSGRSTINAVTRTLPPVPRNTEPIQAVHAPVELHTGHRATLPSTAASHGSACCATRRSRPLGRQRRTVCNLQRNHRCHYDRCNCILNHNRSCNRMSEHSATVWSHLSCTHASRHFSSRSHSSRNRSPHCTGRRCASTRSKRFFV